jgi:ABC-type Na+ efflux pump permease subunit
VITAKSGFASRTLPNITAVARREITSRIRTRAYRFTTVFLVILGDGLAMLPTIIQLVDRGSTGERIEVVAGDALPGVDAAAAFQQLLNASAGRPSIPTDDSQAPSRFTVVAAPDLETARRHVLDEEAAAALVLGRDTTGDLTFDLPIGRESGRERESAQT